MSRFWVGVITGLAGCSFSAKLNGSSVGGPSGPSGGGGGSSSSASSSSGGSGSSGVIAVPDLRGLTPAQAEAKLRAAGFTFDKLAVDDHLCSGDDEHMVARDTVCEQRPPAGGDSQARMLAPSVTVERNTYEHGGVGGGSEWRRMPDLVGKPIDVARTVLARASLPVGEQFEIIEDHFDGCLPQQVCRTEPAAKARKVLVRKGRLYVGKASDDATPAPAKPATGDTYF